MRITVGQLRRVIKEEASRILVESDGALSEGSILDHMENWRKTFEVEDEKASFKTYEPESVKCLVDYVNKNGVSLSDEEKVKAFEAAWKAAAKKVTDKQVDPRAGTTGGWAFWLANAMDVVKKKIKYVYGDEGEIRNYFSQSSLVWDKAKEDFENMAAGGQGGKVKRSDFLGWNDKDFENVVVGVQSYWLYNKKFCVPCGKGPFDSDKLRCPECQEPLVAFKDLGKEEKRDIALSK